ncbi:MAG TPA: hypothetical protein VFE33_11170 [Thermoanaerobaculia bacterium]|nr:hypothetical protein [Thermoanaerobaculia bacterium]
MDRKNTTLIAALALAAIALVALLGCNGRTDRTDGGGVLLSVTQLQLPPTQFVLHNLATNPVLPSIPTVTLQNIVKDPSAASTSQLENIELRSYEVTFTRADTGKRVPPPLVASLGGVVPVNGTFNINTLAVIYNNQVDTLPISDIAQFGVDRETNSTIIVLNVNLRFFGRTLGGQEVQSNTVGFTMEVFQ